jgi:hypothetical protein
VDAGEGPGGWLDAGSGGCVGGTLSEYMISEAYGRSLAAE